MKRFFRNILTVLLALVFLFSARMFVRQQLDKVASRNSHSEALALVATGGETTQSVLPTVPETAPPAPETEPETQAAPQPVWLPAPPEEEDPHIRELSGMDLESLRQVNPDVVGWILIPDTAVNYPLMQGQDNDYYLTRTWEKKSNSAGSIFLEYLNSSLLTDFNTIVYGHNMKNGSMFAELLHYRKPEYRDAHPYIYIRSDQGVYRYEVFSAYLADVDSFTYDLRFPSTEARAQFLSSAADNSDFSCDVRPETTDRVLTLSTCSAAGDYSTRWVVHARLKMVQLPPQ